MLLKNNLTSGQQSVGLLFPVSEMSLSSLSQAYVSSYTEFSFNFKESIFRHLQSLRVSDGQHLPFVHFIATPLLPYGQLDVGLQIGSVNIGDALNDMTKAIYAFAHFGLIYTFSSVIFKVCV